MKIEEIEGIGAVHAAKLGAAGVETTDHLLERAGSAAGREALAAQTGHSAQALLDQVERTARLIRSKGVGVYFVTQAPTDVPSSVLPQLGNRVEHALRAFTQTTPRRCPGPRAPFP